MGLGLRWNLNSACAHVNVSFLYSLYQWTEALQPAPSASYLISSRSPCIINRAPKSFRGALIRVCVCVCVWGNALRGVQRITVIMSSPIHDMSDTIIHPGKTRVQNTGNGTLHLPLLPSPPLLPPPTPWSPHCLSDWQGAGWLRLHENNLRVPKGHELMPRTPQEKPDNVCFVAFVILINASIRVISRPRLVTLHVMHQAFQKCITVIVGSVVQLLLLLDDSQLAAEKRKCLMKKIKKIIWGTKCSWIMYNRAGLFAWGSAAGSISVCFCQRSQQDTNEKSICITSSHSASVPGGIQGSGLVRYELTFSLAQWPENSLCSILNY